jgi:hypothetical protein
MLPPEDMRRASFGVHPEHSYRVGPLLAHILLANVSERLFLPIPRLFVDSHLTRVTVWEMTPGSGGAESGEAW